MLPILWWCYGCCFVQAEDGIRDLVRSRGLGDVYKRQYHIFALTICALMGAHFGAMNLLIPNPRDIPGLVRTLAKYRINMFPAVNTPVSYTHLRAHETVLDLVCRLLLEKKKKQNTQYYQSAI